LEEKIHKEESMSFMQRNSRLIAVSLVITFLCLLQVSVAPLQAQSASSTTKMDVNKSKAPGFIEEEGSSGRRYKKKGSAMPIILGLVAVGALAAVLFLVVLKTKYEIMGTWDVSVTMPAGWNVWESEFVFSGTKESGTFNEVGDTGTYTVDGKNVRFSYNTATTINWVFTGTFTDKNTITGTVTGTAYGGANGSIIIPLVSQAFTATRTSTPMSSNVAVPMDQNKRVAKKFGGTR